MKQINYNPENYERCLKRDFASFKKTLSGRCSPGKVSGKLGNITAYLNNVPEFDDEETTQRVNQLIIEVCDFLENSAYLKLILGEPPKPKVRGSIYPVKSSKALPGSFGSKQ